MKDMPHAPLDKALQLGMQMLGAACQQSWDIVSGLRPDYDEAIRLGATGDAGSYDLLRQIEQQHQQLVQLTAQARDAAARESGQQRHNHRALSAYLSSSPVR